MKPEHNQSFIPRINDEKVAEGLCDRSHDCHTAEADPMADSVQAEAADPTSDMDRLCNHVQGDSRALAGQSHSTLDRVARARAGMRREGDRSTRHGTQAAGRSVGHAPDCGCGCAADRLTGAAVCSLPLVGLASPNDLSTITK